MLVHGGRVDLEQMMQSCTEPQLHRVPTTATDMPDTARDTSRPRDGTQSKQRSVPQTRLC